MNRRSTAAELGKVEFAFMKISLTAEYELRLPVVVQLIAEYLSRFSYSWKKHCNNLSNKKCKFIVTSYMLSLAVVTVTLTD